jgi:hypothetical protein
LMSYVWLEIGLRADVGLGVCVCTLWGVVAGPGWVWRMRARMVRVLQAAGPERKPDQRIVPISGVGSVVAAVSGCAAPALCSAVCLLVATWCGLRS